MINEGKQRAQMLARTGVEVIAERLPISAIVKCPLLALRYSLPDQEKVSKVFWTMAAINELERSAGFSSSLPPIWNTIQLSRICVS